MKNFSSYLSGLPDEDLVFNIQREYYKYVKMYKWHCNSCNQDFEYDKIKTDKIGYDEFIKCPKCNSNLIINTNLIDTNYYDSSYTTKDGQFKSLFFNELTSRYKNKINKDCQSLQEIERKDVFSELFYVYFKSIMNYGSHQSLNNSKFNTYMWSSIKKKHVDFSREKGRITKNPNVKCMVCGKQTGMINPNHLMIINKKYSKESEEYMGHSKFHEFILNKYKINQEEMSEKQIHSFLNSKVISEYQTLFPDAQLYVRQISIDQNNVDDPDYSLYMKIPSDDATASIYENDDCIIYENYIYDYQCLESLKDEYPSLFNHANSQESLHKISKNYQSLEEQSLTRHIMMELSKMVIDNYCVSDCGVNRRHRFYDKDENIDNSIIEIVAEALELYLIYEYPDNVVCALYGNEVINTNDFKHWIKILESNPDCIKKINDISTNG